MTKEEALSVFEDFKIRRVYDEVSEAWLFSVVDVIAALLGQRDYQAARNYWKVLKNRLKKEGSASTAGTHGNRDAVGRTKPACDRSIRSCWFRRMGAGAIECHNRSR